MSPIARIARSADAEDNATMTPAERQILSDRRDQIAQELEDLSEGKVLAGGVCLAVREGQSLEEQDEIEYLLGCAYFEPGSE